jgi:hypothetical protein
MDAVMTRILTSALRVGLILALTSGVASAQNAPSPASAPGGLWVVGGGSATTLLGDCTDCPADTYVHSGGVLAIVGKSLTPRTDVGFEVFWVPAEAAATGDQINTTYLMGTFQFRPWLSKGFFLRFSSGMALVRNWIVTDQAGSESFTSKAFALEIGGGWEWRLSPRFGTQVFGAQHVAALGDLVGSAGRVENVMGNFWSAGAAFVIR